MSVLVCVLYANAAKTIDSHLSGADLQRLQQVFGEGLKSNDIQSVYYGAINYATFTPKEKEETCKRIAKLHKDSKLNEFEKNFYLVATYKKLLCTSPIPESLQDSITLKKEFTSAHEIYYTYFATQKLSNPISDEIKANLFKNLQSILKKDDSLSSLGHAFHVAAELGALASPLADWIEGTFAQADEIDGKLLQFEGGLSTTALLINGAFK